MSSAARIFMLHVPELHCLKGICRSRLSYLLLTNLYLSLLMAIHISGVTFPSGLNHWLSVLTRRTDLTELRYYRTLQWSVMLLSRLDFIRKNNVLFTLCSKYSWPCWALFLLKCFSSGTSALHYCRKASVAFSSSPGRGFPRIKLLYLWRSAPLTLIRSINDYPACRLE